MTHTNRNCTSLWAGTVTPDTEGRCPIGRQTVWIECLDKSVTRVTALKTLKDLLVKENLEEESTVTVICQSKCHNLKTFCERPSQSCPNVILTLLYLQTSPGSCSAPIRRAKLTRPHSVCLRAPSLVSKT